MPDRSPRSEVGILPVARMQFYKAAPFGWHGTHTYFGGNDTIGICPEYGWWRPTRKWVESVVRADIAKLERRRHPEIVEVDV